MKHPTREELIEQLKALANDETEVPISMGAPKKKILALLHKDYE